MRSTRSSTSAWPGRAPTRCCRKARSTSREFQQAYAAFDMAAANKLLDEIGLTKRDDDGFRLLPDGRPMTIIVETAGAGAGGIRRAGADPRQLGPGRHPSVHQALRARRVPQPRLRRRQHHVGLDGAGERPAHGRLQPLGAGARRPERSGMAEMGPVPRDPRHVGRSRLTCPRPSSCWICWTNGVLQRTTRRGRTIWEKMLSIYTDQVFTIGTVAAVPQPVVVSNRLHNVPQGGDLELLAGQLTSASTGPISSGSTRRPSRIPAHVPLCRPTPGDHDPDPARDQLPGLRHHPGAARATISPPISRSCAARARRSIPRASPPSAPNTGSTSPSSCNT